MLSQKPHNYTFSLEPHNYLLNISITCHLKAVIWFTSFGTHNLNMKFIFIFSNFLISRTFLTKSKSFINFKKIGKVHYYIIFLLNVWNSLPRYC
jgi:hypothetical protein